MTSTPKPLVRGEVEVYELPSRVELPAHVRRIRARHENSDVREAPAQVTPLVERPLEDLDVRIG